MRECLGWMTNCTNEQSCPQNWLEHAVTEIPRRIQCHVCGSEVSLVGSPEAYTAAAEGGTVVSFPVVPPIALGAEGQPAFTDPRGPAPASPPDGPSPGPNYDEGLLNGHAEGGVPSPADDPVRAPTPVPGRRQWVCTLANGETIRVDKDAMVIGRSRTCDIVIPSAKVSRQHAKVSFSGGELWIEDLGSANGVWHNGEKVAQTKVGNGDTFTISDETLLFEVR